MDTKNTQGQLSAETVELLSKADRKLFAAFQYLEATAIAASQDIAGGEISEVSDETGNLIQTHPLVKAVWELVGSIEDKHSKLQELLALEKTR